jgi:hypothetical protein
MQYTLKLVKVGGMTRWAVHDGRKTIGALFETYGQAAAERSRVEAKDRRSETDPALEVTPDPSGRGSATRGARRGQRPRSG